MQAADRPHVGPGGVHGQVQRRLQRPVLGHPAEHPPALVEHQHPGADRLPQRRKGRGEQHPPTRRASGNPGGDMPEGMDEAVVGQDPGDPGDVGGQGDVGGRVGGGHGYTGVRTQKVTAAPG
jgi:hypothetical protein